MNTDGELKLNPNSLDEAARLIELFCVAQQKVLSDCLRKIYAVGDAWIDAATFEARVLSTMQALKINADNFLSELKTQYPKYYKERAQMIIDRPKFRAGVSVGNNSGSDFGNSKPKDLKSSIEEVFIKTNKEIRQKIFTYLLKINFIEHNARSSYYDPYGRSKRGLYKNIMAVNINSPTFNQDLTDLTAQHIFFYMSRKQQLNIITSLNSEIKNNAQHTDTRFKECVNKIKNGDGLDFSYIDVSDSDYKSAMSFFTHAFREYTNGTTDVKSEMNKYFSHTYSRFCEILTNLDGVK